MEMRAVCDPETRAHERLMCENKKVKLIMISRQRDESSLKATHRIGAKRVESLNQRGNLPLASGEDLIKSLS